MCSSWLVYIIVLIILKVKFIWIIWFLLFRYVFVGDVVVLKDLNEIDKFLVRRLVVLEGFEMVLIDVKEEFFVFEKD